MVKKKKKEHPKTHRERRWVCYTLLDISSESEQAPLHITPYITNDACLPFKPAHFISSKQPASAGNNSEKKPTHTHIHTHTHAHTSTNVNEVPGETSE